MNEQILIKTLPSGKLSADHYERVASPMPEIQAGEVLVKTNAFAITAGTRAGLQGSASYAGAPTTGIVMAAPVLAPLWRPTQTPCRWVIRS